MVVVRATIIRARNICGILADDNDINWRKRGDGAWRLSEAGWTKPLKWRTSRINKKRKEVYR